MENDEKKTAEEMSDEEVKAYADILKEKKESEENASWFKKTCTKIRNWMQDHPVLTFLIGLMTGGVAVILTLIIVSAVAGKRDDTIEIDDIDTSTDSDDDFGINVEV